MKQFFSRLCVVLAIFSVLQVVSASSGQNDYENKSPQSNECRVSPTRRGSFQPQNNGISNEQSLNNDLVNSSNSNQSQPSLPSSFSYPYYCFGKPPPNSVVYNGDERHSTTFEFNPDYNSICGSEPMDSLVTRIQRSISPNEKIFYFSPKENTYKNLTEKENTLVNFIIYLCIQSKKNFIFPFVVIEDVRLIPQEVLKLDILFQADERIVKVMFNRVKFEESSIFYFHNYAVMLKEIIFVDCIMSEDEEKYLRNERKPNQIIFTVINSNRTA